jgi:hypothetical protein
MDALSRFVLRLIDSNRHGGRTILTDDNTVVLYDCGHWSDTHSQAIRERYPECEVEIMPSDGSLSGFIVVVKAHRDQSINSWIMATGVVFALLMMTTHHILKEGG